MVGQSPYDARAFNGSSVKLPTTTGKSSTDTAPKNVATTAKWSPDTAPKSAANQRQHPGHEGLSPASAPYNVEWRFSCMGISPTNG